MPAMSNSPRNRLGPYELHSSLGVGGMGEVFRARDTRLNRDVAVKVLPKDFGTDADRLRRFEQEITVTLEGNSARLKVRVLKKYIPIRFKNENQ